MSLALCFVIIAFVFALVEIFAPTLFCINFAIGAIITAICAIFTKDILLLTLIFIILSLVSLIFLRPILSKAFKKELGGLSSDYIGKIVKTIEPITTSSGAVTIYEERWEARIKEGEEIPTGVDVKIIENDSLILYVEKV